MLNRKTRLAAAAAITLAAAPTLANAQAVTSNSQPAAPPAAATPVNQFVPVPEGAVQFQTRRLVMGSGEARAEGLENVDRQVRVTCRRTPDGPAQCKSIAPDGTETPISESALPTFSAPPSGDSAQRFVVIKRAPAE